LGGLLGMVLTLIIMLIVSGTLDFAPHREVVALSRNLGTMRSDQEMAWQRIEQLSQRVGELERQVRRLEALSDRVAGLEKDLAAIRDDTKKLAVAFDALRSDVGKELSRLDQRVAEMQGTVQRIQERVRRFDAFFTSLRDLLDEMQGPAQSAEGQEPGALPTPEGR
jgi:chromosome segregation ATPase